MSRLLGRGHHLCLFSAFPSSFGVLTVPLTGNPARALGGGAAAGYAPLPHLPLGPLFGFQAGSIT